MTSSGVPIRRFDVLLLALCLVAQVPVALAQQPTPEQTSAIRSACRSDYQKVCSSVPTGGSASLTCLQQHAASTSAGCQKALSAVSAPSGTAAPATAPAASTAASPPVASAAGTSTNAAATTATTATQGAATGGLITEPVSMSWPSTVTTANGSAVVYEPQVISWADRQTLVTRMALEVRPNGAAASLLGTMEVSFSTSTDLATRWVALSSAKLISAHFPSADATQEQRMDERIRTVLAALPVKHIPLDTVLLSLNRSSEQPPPADLHNEPPQIFVSEGPASLLVFDGDPVMAPVNGTTLTFAVNTNWDIFFDAETSSWYWLNDGAWLRAAVVKGPWAPAGPLPSAFTKLPDDSSFAAVRQQMPGKTITAADLPQIFVSTSPAEIIVTQGAPQMTDVPSTALQYVANTDAALFFDKGTSLYYYLVSGRWFSAASLNGPWQFATYQLPADFMRIPADGPRGFVLVSVPGTEQAQEALIQASIPQQATLEIATTKLEVPYSGEPQFEAIAGTTLTYAVNTSYNVVRLDNAYYACYQGAWFVAPSPTGTWVLAGSVPAAIYTIPPGSPLYPCTYVRVYSSTPTTVTYGYTSGYTMAYVSYGVVVYGTGYYYPPVIWRGPVPIYYPYPVTYAGATYYNSATGAWAHGGAIYGPYYGARGGTAYNPQTGAWARGGSVYGPYGGAGAFSAYNPTTGSYAHGSAVWGPDGASGNASWYNARTGISGSTNQNSNAYGHWGSSTISGPNQTVHTQSQGNARGSTGSFSSSTGAEGAGVHGAGGNNAGAVKTAGGDVYAGADGNVYKKTDNGWEKYDGGSWNPVQTPDKPSGGTSAGAGTRANSAANRTDSNLSGATAQGATPSGRATTGVASSGRENPEANSSKAGWRNGNGAPGASGGRSFPASDQLNHDFQARQGGAQRQQQFGEGRSRSAGGGRVRN